MKNNSGTSIIEIEPNRIERCYYNYRNMMYIYKKKSKKDLLKFLVRYFINIFKILLFSKNKRLKRILTITKGVFLGIFFNPHIEIVN